MTHLELLDLITDLEREWDHAAGIAEALNELRTAVRDDLIPHEWPATNFLRFRQMRTLTEVKGL